MQPVTRIDTHEPMLKLADLDLRGKRVLVREDLNVPLDDEGRVACDTRLRAALPTIRHVLDAGAALMLMSHLGRPEEGVFDDAYSLAPVARRLSELLGIKVRLERDWLDGVPVAPGEIVLCENVRFNAGEQDNDPALSRRMAALCDVFVMDAFATAHRAQASTCGVAEFAPAACAGPLLLAEIEALSRALEDPARPLVAIVGGAKVSGKLALLDALTGVVDRLIVGGGIANTFIAAAGHNIGKSLHEHDFIDEARRLMAAADARGSGIPLPVDVVVAQACAAGAEADVRKVDEVSGDEMILDIGPDTMDAYAKVLKTAGTIVWNGPVGVFEYDQFGEGTRALAQAIAESPAYSIAAGGDTLAAVEKYAVSDRISYVSTGGGAFLEFLEGKKLPAVAMLERRARA